MFERVCLEADRHFAFVSSIDYLDRCFGGVCAWSGRHREQSARFQFSGGLCQRGPCAIRVRMQEKNFYSPSGIGLHRLQPGRQHPAVVCYQQVARSEPTLQIDQAIVRDPPRLSIQDKQSRRGTVGKRLLGDEFRRELVIEIGNQEVR
jgi:hypothetical protein